MATGRDIAVALRAAYLASTAGRPGYLASLVKG
jgi:hypothetical protein